MPKRIHQGVKELKNNLDKGRLSRREFIRYASLLGLSAAASTQMAGLLLKPARAHAATIQRGGVMKIASPVQKVTHPSNLSWISPTNQLRAVAEYLTYTDADNVTHPYLLKNWEVSDDLKTWTLNLRQGIKFNNGDDFSADDVVFTMNEWFKEDVGSSMMGMMGGYLDPTGIEKVNAHQVKLHLKMPEIGVPEHLFHYPAMIFNHRTFEGDFIKAPHGTGPYTLERYVEGESCVIKRRNDYWQKGADGKLLPYLDEVHFIDMGTEMSPMIAGIKGGEIDMIDFGDLGATDAYLALKDDPNISIYPITTNQTRIVRMRADLKPWSDNRVRQALKLCQNREKTLGLAFFGEGLIAQDIHVSPKHPEYAPIETPKYDPERAKQLLKEAGYPNGIDVNIAVGNGWKEIVRYAEILKQDAAPAGFRINIQTMPNSQYWEKWTDVDLGITTWSHRPLGTMVLNLAYTGDSEGKPVAWNETRWVDKEFSTLLTQANATFDLEKRRAIFAKLEKIQQDRGSIGNSFWVNTWFITSKKIQGVKAHPSGYSKLDDLWIKS
ncbi:MAG: ABC transporter substrate-binding protein [Desulfobacterales bacterium]|nr:ABC transporter substrate-binding protein [Desulfobacterales bacterium]